MIASQWLHPIFLSHPFLKLSSLDNTPGTHTEAAWFTSSMDVSPLYTDNIAAPDDNQIQSIRPAITSNETAKQNDWWADIMNDDWKDILDATATDSRSKVRNCRTIMSKLVAPSSVLVV
jgi:hypothetical protein